MSGEQPSPAGLPSSCVVAGGLRVPNGDPGSPSTEYIIIMDSSCVRTTSDNDDGNQSSPPPSSASTATNCPKQDLVVKAIIPMTDGRKALVCGQAPSVSSAASTARPTTPGPRPAAATPGSRTILVTTQPSSTITTSGPRSAVAMTPGSPPMARALVGKMGGQIINNRPACPNPPLTRGPMPAQLMMSGGPRQAPVFRPVPLVRPCSGEGAIINNQVIRSGPLPGPNLVRRPHLRPRATSVASSSTPGSYGFTLQPRPRLIMKTPATQASAAPTPPAFQANAHRVNESPQHRMNPQISESQRMLVPVARSQMQVHPRSKLLPQQMPLATQHAVSTPLPPQLAALPIPLPAFPLPPPKPAPQGISQQLDSGRWTVTNNVAIKMEVDSDESMTSSSMRQQITFTTVSESVVAPPAPHPSPPPQQHQATTPPPPVTVQEDSEAGASTGTGSSAPPVLPPPYGPYPRDAILAPIGLQMSKPWHPINPGIRESVLLSGFKYIDDFLFDLGFLRKVSLRLHMRHEEALAYQEANSERQYKSSFLGKVTEKVNQAKAIWHSQIGGELLLRDLEKWRPIFTIVGHASVCKRFQAAHEDKYWCHYPTRECRHALIQFNHATIECTASLNAKDDRCCSNCVQLKRAYAHSLLCPGRKHRQPCPFCKIMRAATMEVIMNVQHLKEYFIKKEKEKNAKRAAPGEPIVTQPTVTLKQEPMEQEEIIGGDDHVAGHQDEKD